MLNNIRILSTSWTVNLGSMILIVALIGGLRFVADVEKALARGGRRAEEVTIAAIVQVQALPQLLGRHREVAGSNVGTGDAA